MMIMLFQATVWVGFKAVAFLHALYASPYRRCSKYCANKHETNQYQPAGRTQFHLMLQVPKIKML